MQDEKPKAYQYIGNTYAAQLKEFAKSVDILNENVFEPIKMSVIKYLDNNFNIKVIGHLVPDHIQWGAEGILPGLDITEWMNGGKKWGYPIKDKDGVYYGQVSYAYGEKKELWIVSGDDKNEVIVKEGSYDNLFDLILSDNLPDFVPSNENLAIKTSVIFPILQDETKPPVGVVNFESTERLRFLDINVNELRTIAEAIHIIYRAKTWYENTRKETHDRVEEIKELSDLSFWEKERRVFFAYPNHCEQDVIEIVKRFFRNEYTKKRVISLFTWEDIPKGRYVMDEIWKLIDNCQVGICYFSEIRHSESDEKPKTLKYKDNLNVFYEAGMMHALHETRKDVFREWLIFREKDSDDIPFNVSMRNIEIIDRDFNKPLSKVAHKNIEKQLHEFLENTFFKSDKDRRKSDKDFK